MVAVYRFDWRRPPHSGYPYYHRGTSGVTFDEAVMDDPHVESSGQEDKEVSVRVT
jgi:hypothetical protein